MSYRSIVVSNPAKISIKDNNLIVNTDSKHWIPIEDISVLVLENHQISISVYALSLLADNGVCVFTCDKSHSPNGVYTPLNTHSRQLKAINSQIEATSPFKKQIWKKIIRQKVKNQALCLEYSGFYDANKLYAMIDEIKSGDSSHVEAKAAAYYFKTMFGDKFSRKSDNFVNGALNYGYSIIRGIICRSLVCNGLEPVLGVFHHSELNNFNLADDIIEPFRPVVDLYVFQNVNLQEGTLDNSTMRGLRDIQNLSVLIKNQKQSILYAVDLVVQSYSKSLSAKEDCMILPELIMTEIFVPKELRTEKEGDEE